MDLCTCIDLRSRTNRSNGQLALFQVLHCRYHHSLPLGAVLDGNKPRTVILMARRTTAMTSHVTQLLPQMANPDTVFAPRALRSMGMAAVVQRARRTATRHAPSQCRNGRWLMAKNSSSKLVRGFKLLASSTRTLTAEKWLSGSEINVGRRTRRCMSTNLLQVGIFACFHERRVESSLGYHLDTRTP